MNDVDLTELRNLIDKADAAYYHPGQNHVLISDFEYDLLKQTLKKSCPEDPRLSRVGFVSDEREKIAHPFPMGSLDNTDNGSEGIGPFIENANNGLLKDEFFVLSHKIDGSSIRASYRKGLLVEVVTRGNGLEGTNITSNGRMFKDLPLILAQPVDIDVRGEAVLYRTDFDELTKDEEDKSNPRNVGNGIIGRDDGLNSDKIRFIAFDCFADNIGGNKPIDTLSEKYKYLKSLGFTVVDHKLLKGKESIAKYTKMVLEQRASLPYDTDGVVMIVDSLKIQDSFNEVSTNLLRPKYARAIKFPHLFNTTVVEDIILSVGHTGAIIPTAVLKKVRIGGVYVTHALLNNWDEIDRLNVGIGSEVKVVLAGDIIPKVVETISGQGPAPEPDNCLCGAATTREIRGTVGALTYCSKYSNCQYAMREKISHWIGDSKRGAGILGIGSSILAELIDSGLVKDPSDLYKLQVEDIANLKIGGKIAVGTSRAMTIVNNIKAKSTLKLNKFLGCLGIDLLGSRRAQQLIKDSQGRLSTIEQWLDEDNLKSTLSSLTGTVISNSIVTGIFHNRHLIDKLLKVVKIGEEEMREQVDSVNPASPSLKSFEGLSFCLTGTRECISDIERLGGTIKSGVSKGLSFLVQADPMSVSGKSKKAEEYGIRIISIDYLKSAIAGEVDLKAEVEL